MLGIGEDSGVHPALQPVEFRRGIAVLSVYARENPGIDPASEIVLVFRPRRPGRVKVLRHDGSWMALVTKWPDRRSLRWLSVSKGVLRLSRAERNAGSRIRPAAESSRSSERAAQSFRCPEPSRQSQRSQSAIDTCERLQSGCDDNSHRISASSARPIRRP